MVQLASRNSSDGDIARGVDELLASLRRTDEQAVPYETHLPAVRSKSHGYVHRYMGISVPVMHHLQSTGEFELLHVLDLSHKYTNIRTGFPLPRSLTEPIAETLGIKHPFNRFAGENATMSVDFICTELKGRWIAIDYKPSSLVTRKRVQDKFLIARTALAEIGVNHLVMTEKHLPRQLIENLQFLYQFASPINPPPLAMPALMKAGDALGALLFDGTITVFAAARIVANEFAQPPATLVRVAFWLIANRYWHVDLNQAAHPEKPLRFHANRNG